MMEQTREKAFAAFDSALDRLDSASREPGAWAERNLIEALVAVVAGDYQRAFDKIDAAESQPTAAEIAIMTKRELLTVAEFRIMSDDLKVAGRRGATEMAESLPSRARARENPATRS